MSEQFLSVSQAAKRLNTSRFTVSTLIQRGMLEEYQTELDRRQRLVKAEDVDRLQKAAIRKREVGAAVGVAA